MGAFPSLEKQDLEVLRGDDLPGGQVHEQRIQGALHAGHPGFQRDEPPPGRGPGLGPGFALTGHRYRLARSASISWRALRLTRTPGGTVAGCPLVLP